MLPIPVHERRPEKGVVLGRHPVDERLPGIVFGGNRGRLSAQAGWSHGLLRLGIGGRRRTALIDHAFFADLGSRLALHAREKGGETVIVLLAPFFKRMVVAAGTLNSQ